MNYKKEIVNMLDKIENDESLSKKSLAMQLYCLLVDEDAVDLQEYGAEQFLERFEEVLQDYGLFLKSTMIE